MFSTFGYWPPSLSSPIMLTSGCLHSSLVLLHDPDNIGISVGNSLLTFLQADICVVGFSKPLSLISDFPLLTFQINISI